MNGVTVNSIMLVARIVEMALSSRDKNSGRTGLILFLSALIDKEPESCDIKLINHWLSG